MPRSHENLAEPFHEWWLEKLDDGRVELTTSNGNAQGDGDHCRIILTVGEASSLGYRLEHEAHWT